MVRSWLRNSVVFWALMMWTCVAIRPEHIYTYPHSRHHPTHHPEWQAYRPPTELWHTQNTQRESVSYFSLCVSFREKWRGKYVAVSVCILRASAGRWVVLLLLQTITGKDESGIWALWSTKQSRTDFTVAGHHSIPLSSMKQRLQYVWHCHSRVRGWGGVEI